jgi:PPOX class probable F420-dependent enzyme
MTVTPLAQFVNQSFINVETYRKNGMAVKTTVWFYQDGENFFIRTGPESGKVKRIRHNASVQIAPCKMNGALLGIWIAGKAQLITDKAEDDRINRLFSKKYGIQKALFDAAGKLSGRSLIAVTIVVQPELQPTCQS